jgi:hypothetical protein
MAGVNRKGTVFPSQSERYRSYGTIVEMFVKWRAEVLGDEKGTQYPGV